MSRTLESVIKQVATNIDDQAFSHIQNHRLYKIRRLFTPVYKQLVLNDQIEQLKNIVMSLDK